MASWTNQSTSSLLPGEPWTSAKALAAFENPEAIAEGASGAPKVLTAALQPPAAGGNIIYRVYTPILTAAAGGPDVDFGHVNALVPGVIRVSVSVDSITVPAEIQVKKNGAVENTITATGIQNTDITVAQGDLIVITGVPGAGASGSITINNILIRSATVNMAVA